MQRIEHDVDVFRGGNYQIIWRENSECYHVELRGITLEGNKYVLGGVCAAFPKEKHGTITDSIKKDAEEALVKRFKGNYEYSMFALCMEG